jgi:hypothetical protein
MPLLAFQHEFLVGAFAAVKGGSVQEVLAHIGEHQAAARSRGGEKVEGLADTCFRQILGDSLPDEERGPLGPVAVVGQDIGEVLGVEIDGTKVTSAGISP